MSRLDIVVYPRDLNGAEAAFNRLGWQTLERFGDGVEEYGIVFRIPADDVRLELVTHAESRALATTVGSDTVAGLRIGVSDADAAWRAARLAGLRSTPRAPRARPMPPSAGSCAPSRPAGSASTSCRCRHSCSRATKLPAE